MQFSEEFRVAFDMYFGSRREAVFDYEQYLLAMAEPARFPQLSTISARFYERFSLSPQQANACVHELLAILDEYGPAGNNAISLLVLRLVSFFSAAYRTGENIQCVGD